MARTPALIAVVITAFLCASCTTGASPSGSPTAISPSASGTVHATPSPSQSASLSTDQAAAAKAVDDYRAAIRPIANNPSAYSESQMRAILEKVAGGDVVEANLGSYLSLKKRGFRYDGDATVASTKVGAVGGPSYGVEVAITKCLDQRGIRVLDKAGREVSESELGYGVPDFNLRQYTVIKRTGTKAFLVYGIATVKGACGP